MLDRQEIGRRIAQARTRKGWNRGKLAKTLGVSLQTISLWERGKNTPDEARRLDVAEKLGVSVEYMMGKGEGASAIPAAPLRMPPRPAPSDLEHAFLGLPDIPVLGTSAGGSAGDFVLNGETIDYVRRPAGVATRKGVFVLLVQGTSMVPWKQPGDAIYLDDVRPPKPGDYVVVECKPAEEGEAGPAYLKLLVADQGSKVRLAQHNPPLDKIEIPRARIKKIYRVIPFNELVGI